MALVVATRAKQDPNLLSLSRIRYFGTCPYGVASRSCCATQESVGDRVTPTWITFRDVSSMMKNANSGRKMKSVTCMKSQARSVLHDCAQRLPTSGLLAEECEHASCTSEWFACLHECRVSGVPRESSQHRRRRFSFAISLINAIVSAATLGLCEEAFDLRFQSRRNSSRCQRRRVSG
jgi:hypothetical protein